MTTPQDEWARLKHHIEAALATSPGLETLEDVEAAVASGHYQVWFGHQSIAITEIASYPRRKVLTVIHGGGDLAELLDEMEPQMCAFAVENGCDLIMGQGRRGWERVTEKRGYRHGFVTMVKDLKQ